MIALLVAAGVVNDVDLSTLAVANHTIAAEMHFSAIMIFTNHDILG